MVRTPEGSKRVLTRKGLLQFRWPLLPEMEDRWAGAQGTSSESAQECRALGHISKAKSGHGRSRADPPTEPLEVTGEPETLEGSQGGVRAEERGACPG